MGDHTRESEEKICPKCDNKMTRIYEGQQRLVLNQLVILPGPLKGYRCEKCGHEEGIKEDV